MPAIAPGLRADLRHLWTQVSPRDHGELVNLAVQISRHNHDQGTAAESARLIQTYRTRRQRALDAATAARESARAFLVEPELPDLAGAR